MNQTQQTDYIEVLKDILKNCDMETHTAVEKLFRQALTTATQQAVEDKTIMEFLTPLAEEFEKEMWMAPQGMGMVYLFLQKVELALSQKGTDGK